MKPQNPTPNLPLIRFIPLRLFAYPSLRLSAPFILHSVYPPLRLSTTPFIHHSVYPPLFAYLLLQIRTLRFSSIKKKTV